ncbi:MAG: multiheme c-type cytochrome [Mariprofundales bacterium]
MKKLIFPVALIIVGLLLTAASSSNSWLADHWDQPQATTSMPPNHWSALERNLHPEACAQCHQQQFNDWKFSRHAHAFSPGLVGQFAGMGTDDANDCLTCHTPLAEQKFNSNSMRRQSLADLRDHPLGFDPYGNVNAVATPLTHAGVTCASCHVRGWQRFGPPVRGSMKTGHIKRAIHGGFTAKKEYLSSQFCASCHQFPQSYAINGKPLENTLFEWKQSRFARENISCQQCHMPNRKHEFRGVHDAKMVLSGLKIESRALAHGAVLSIHSIAIGHAFPTYVTPRVIITAKALNNNNKELKHWRWIIERQVEYSNGWQETRDNRIMPDETRDFIVEHAPDTTSTIHFVITIIPDHFYKGVYRSLLDNGDTKDPARTLLQRALDDANANDYQLFSVDLSISKWR